MTDTYTYGKTGKNLNLTGEGNVVFAVDEAWQYPYHELKGKYIVPYIEQQGGSFVVKPDMQKEAKLRNIYDFGKKAMTDEKYIEVKCTAKEFDMKNRPKNIGFKGGIPYFDCERCNLQALERAEYKRKHTQMVTNSIALQNQMLQEKQALLDTEKQKKPMNNKIVKELTSNVETIKSTITKLKTDTAKPFDEINQRMKITFKGVTIDEDGNTSPLVYWEPKGYQLIELLSAVAGDALNVETPYNLIQAGVLNKKKFTFKAYMKQGRGWGGTTSMQVHIKDVYVDAVDTTIFPEKQSYTPMGNKEEMAVIRQEYSVGTIELLRQFASLSNEKIILYADGDGTLSEEILDAQIQQMVEIVSDETQMPSNEISRMYIADANDDNFDEFFRLVKDLVKELPIDEQGPDATARIRHSFIDLKPIM